MTVNIILSEAAASLALLELRCLRQQYLQYWTRPDGHFDGDAHRLLEFDEVCEELAIAIQEGTR